MSQFYIQPRAGFYLWVSFLSSQGWIVLKRYESLDQLLRRLILTIKVMTLKLNNIKCAHLSPEIIYLSISSWLLNNLGDQELKDDGFEISRLAAPENAGLFDKRRRLSRMIPKLTLIPLGNQPIALDCLESYWCGGGEEGENVHLKTHGSTYGDCG